MSIIKDKKEAIYFLRDFIKEMTNTLLDKDERNRKYAPQVFWKNKYTLEQIAEWLEEEK